MARVPAPGDVSERCHCLDDSGCGRWNDPWTDFHQCEPNAVNAKLDPKKQATRSSVSLPDLGGAYRAATGFLAPLTCLLHLVTSFHFSLTTCFPHHNQADRIALGDCSAVRCVSVLAILPPSPPTHIENHVGAAALSLSPSRLAWRVASIIVRNNQGCGFCSSASASLDFVTISAL
jgi:hypothetical protein